MGMEEGGDLDGNDEENMVMMVLERKAMDPGMMGVGRLCRECF